MVRLLPSTLHILLFYFEKHSGGRLSAFFWRRQFMLLITGETTGQYFLRTDLLRRRRTPFWRLFLLLWLFRNEQFFDMRLHEYECDLLLVQRRVLAVSYRIVVLHRALVKCNQLDQIYASLFDFKLLGNDTLGESIWKILFLLPSDFLHAVWFGETSWLCVNSMLLINKWLWVSFPPILLLQIIFASYFWTALAFQRSDLLFLF